MLLALVASMNQALIWLVKECPGWGEDRKERKLKERKRKGLEAGRERGGEQI